MSLKANKKKKIEDVPNPVDENSITTSDNQSENNADTDFQKDIKEVIDEDGISSYLEKVKFKKKTLGGVDEYDVWKKIKKIDSMYSEVMNNQKAKYEALIEEREKWYASLRKEYNAYKSQHK